jgi:hypothetical protein
MTSFFLKTFTKFRSILWMVLLLGFIAASAQSVDPTLARIPLPPLAWSSWNAFSNTIDSNVAMKEAQALVASGLQKAGYAYVNIDEGWWLGDRDADGNIVVDPKRWPAIASDDHPGDMANIVRFIHSLGLKAGIYTDSGQEGCSMYPDLGAPYSHVGSKGHYEQDFLQFAKWGFDYVKVDWCGGDKEDLSAAVQYAEIARAMTRAENITGKRLYYSICNWGKQSPWTWGPGVGGAEQSIWRVSDDIVAPIVANNVHSDRKVSFDMMLRNFEQGIHPEAQHTGYYNDPDMMVLGMPGLNAEQNRLHMSLWVISGAPLIIGADVAKLDAETLATFSNSDTLAIDQDALGLQCVKVKEQSSGLEVWSKVLSTPGARAVLLLNRTTSPAPMSVEWADLGLRGAAAAVRDVWDGKDLGTIRGPFQATIPAQDGLLLIVRGHEGSFSHYIPATVEDKDRRASDNSETVFDHLAQVSSSFAQIKIVYTNRGHGTKVAGLYVNGETGTNVAFPPTGSLPATVWIQAKLNRPGKTNKLRFTASSTSDFAIKSVEVH